MQPEQIPPTMSELRQLSTADFERLQAELDQLQATILENVSHELRTPLTVILGFSELLKNGTLGALAEEQQEAVYTIVNHATELQKLVEHVSTLIEVETGKGVHKPVALAEIVKTVLDGKQALARQANLSLEVQVETTLPLISGNSRQLLQAVDGLVDNSFKFTPSGGRIRVHLYAEPGWVCLSLADNGIGIPEEELERIFIRFYQVDRSLNRSQGGIGLGLSTARAVVEKHQGQIKVASQPGLGTQFFIKFPALPPGAALEPIDHGRSPAVKQILVVDDEESVAFVLQSGLASLPNCTVSVAHNGEQALAFLEQQPFDLVVTDYSMPGADGISLAEQIKQRYPKTAVIMITAFSDTDLRQRAAQASVRHVLEKPVQIAEVRGVALEALAPPKPGE